MPSLYELNDKLSQAPGENPAPRNPESIGILIVDTPNPDSSRLTQLLVDKGYKVWTLDTGSRALAFAQGDAPICAIVLETDLPDMSGYEVCRQLQTNPQTRAIPVLFVSPRDDSGARLQGFAAGGVDYIVKPFALEEMAMRVVVHARRTADALAQRAQAALLDLGRQAIDAAANPIMIATRAGTIEWVNQAFTELTGYTLEEAVGKNPRDLLKSGMHDHAFYKEMWVTILAGKVWQGVIVNRRKDGSLYTEQMTITPVPDETGEIVRFIAVKMDMTVAQRRLERMQALVGIGNRLNATLDLQSIAQTVCQETAQALQVEAVTLSLYDPEGDRYYHAADVGLPPDYAGRVRAVPSSHIKDRVQETRARAGTVVEEGIVIRYDVQADPHSLNAELYAELGMRTIVSVSLSHGNTVIGRLNLHTIGEPRKFDDEELALLRGLANQAGQSLANARLYAEAQQRLSRLQGLRAIDTAILTPQDLVMTLGVIIRQVADHLAVDAAAVLLLDPETQHLNYATGTGFRHAGIRRSTLHMGEGVAGRAVGEGALKHIPDLGQTDEFTRASLIEGEGFVSYFAVPLVAHDRVLGVMEIFQRELVVPEPEWVSFLEAIGLQTAIAIDHARLFVETHRLLRQTQQQAKLLENVLNTVPEGILFLDKEQRIELANASAQEYLPALNDARAGDILEHFGATPLTTVLAQAGGARWAEIVLPESQRIFEMAARQLQDNGEPGGWVLVLKDVTEERRRLQRTQSQERLASVGQLAAGIAHDFNNILTPILLATDMSLMEVGEESRFGSNLMEIRKATHRAKELIANILAFSRQEAQGERKAIRLQPIVEETLALVRAGLPSTIVIQTHIDPDAGVVLANPTELHQVLMNLCVNAQHAMRETGGQLSVTVAPVEIGPAALESGTSQASPNLAAGVYVRVSVRDTGHGIDQVTLSHIFEPFFTTKGPGEGSGMGLAMVHGIIGSYGGKIVVESEVGKGTAFHIYLKRVADSAEAAVVSIAERSPGNGHILLVDDEAAVLWLLQQSLEYLGYTVTGETESAAALARFREQSERFDLVITDLTMPGMTGDRLAQEVLRVRPDLPVVLITGNNAHMTTAELEAIGIQALLEKPFSIDDLSRTLREVFEAEGQSQGSRA